ncbi:NUDIX hydrolase [Candidatus Giovannonibacteria bacterium]|nr:NUDIX hydrolase [Candidatus Giovannonibacteria bacterium]
MEIKRPESKQPLPENAKRVFKGIIFDVYQWEQELFDGSKAIFEKLKRPDTVVIIPVLENGNILVSRQEQPGKKMINFGLFGGMVDEGESPLKAAKRELLEESGYISEEWELFDSIQPMSKIEWAIYTYIARKCRKVQEQKLEAGEKIEIKEFSFEEFINLIFTEDFYDAELKLKLLDAKLNPTKMDEFKSFLIKMS